MTTLQEVKILEDKLRTRKIGDDVQLGVLSQAWLNKFNAIGRHYLARLKTSLDLYSKDNGSIPDISKELGLEFQDLCDQVDEGLFDNAMQVELLLPSTMLTLL
jgi:hypothetical protein